MKRHGIGDLPGAAHYCHPASDGEEQPSNRFGRMFPKLPPNYTPADLLMKLGEAGGPMDGGTGADRTQTVPVGHVIFGQFIDHDITLDVSSSLSAVAPDGGVPNVRTPTLDLDSIYGDGPEASRFLYEDDARLLTGAAQDPASDLRCNDLLRTPKPHWRAIIGDHRNDENRIISQMQLAMIKYHNHTCDEIAKAYKKKHRKDIDGRELYEHARRHVTWHYQWCVVHDFLVTMCGERVVQDILSNGRKVYCHVSEPYIPVEFAVAAFRYGHSMVPQEIQVQKNADAFAFFGTKLGGGFSELKSTDAIVDWHELFKTSADRLWQRAEKLDTQMASILLALPFVDEPDERSLATRNLLRANSFRLPSGEQVAELMIERGVDDLDQAKVTPVTQKVRDMADGVGSSALDHGGSPLWLYLLAEAEVVGRADGVGGNDAGEGLGPVGARIVAEVLIGLLELDERSYLGANRNWVPNPGESSIGEILASTNWDGLPI